MTTITSFTKSNVVDVLKKNKSVHVTFLKVSTGELRDMNCTLHLDTLNALLADDNRLHGVLFNESIEQDESDQVRVFDLDKNEWRSFVMPNLIEVQING